MSEQTGKKRDPDAARCANGVERVRTGRAIRRERGVALGEFLPKQFKVECERPFKKLGALAGIWEEVIPEVLGVKTALVSFQRGILTVEVASSAVGYELQGLLARGAERTIREAFRGGTLTRIKIVVNAEIQDVPD